MASWSKNGRYQYRIGCPFWRQSQIDLLILSRISGYKLAMRRLHKIFDATASRWIQPEKRLNHMRAFVYILLCIKNPQKNGGGERNVERQEAIF